jgi:hypothetical protein
VLQERQVPQAYKAMLVLQDQPELELQDQPELVLQEQLDLELQVLLVQQEPLV